MKQIRIRKKRNKFILTVLSVFVALLIWQSIDIVAKYYAAKNNKGVAVASGLYFNSDKLNKKQGSTENGINSIKNDEIEGLAITTNTASWSSGSVELPLKIQNYDSNILFNDSGLDITYQIEFKLLDEPVGATYSVIDRGDNNEHPLSNQGQKYISSGTLKGGSLSADTYKIKITLTSDADNYTPSRVLVLAYPMAPDYLVNTNDQQYRLLGVFEGHPNEMELEIDSAAFIIEKEFDSQKSNWKEIVEDSAAYIYNIKTKGDIVQDTSTAAKREIEVRWCSEYLSIDRYSEYYIDATGSVTTATVDGVKWSSMKIEVLPYANINITFYKNEAFITALNNEGEGNKIDSAEAFRNLVQVSVVTE